MIVKTMIKNSFASLSLFGLAIFQQYALADNVNLAAKPLYLAGNVPPMMMLVMGRDHTFFSEAYDDASDINKDGQLIKLDEKPELDFVVNSGTYLFEPDVLNLIPINKKFHATDLIKIALLKKMNVGVYPITSEKWIDIGQFKEYKQLLNKIS